MRVCYTNSIRVGDVVISCLVNKLFTVLNVVQNFTSSRSTESEKETRSMSTTDSTAKQGLRLSRLKRLDISLRSYLSWGHFVIAVGLRKGCTCTI